VNETPTEAEGTSGNPTATIADLTPEITTLFDLEEPIQASSKGLCIYYRNDYDNAASQAEAEGEIEKASAFRMLATLCSFQPQFWNKAEPYEKVRSTGELSGVSVEHIPEDWLVRMKEMAGQTKDPSLKARILDLHWLSTKDHTSCRDAVPAYIESAERLDCTDDWYYGTLEFHRACQLANFLGFNNQPAKDARAALIRALEDETRQHKEEYSRIAWLLKIIWDCGSDDDAKFANLAEAHGQACLESGDFYTARRIWKSAVKLWHSAKDPEASKAIQIRSAQTLVEEARKRSVPGDYLGASKVMEDAIIALRQAGEESAKIKEIQKELRAIQPKAMAEMKTVEFSTDIRAEVLAMRDAFDSLLLDEALLKLSFGQSLVSLEDLREQTEAEANQSIAQLFDGSFYSADARVIHNQKGLVGLEGVDREESLESQMFAHLNRVIWNWRASSFIDPARQKITEQHRLHKADFVFLVSENPFVPPGHEEIFLRGIHAGFHGDFLVASSLLVPQIENSIRYVLTNHGVDVTNYKDDRTQPVKLLGPLFDLPEMKEIFGESCWFELRGLLIEKTGAEVRNKISHGFTSNAECYSPAAKNVWWIVLRLCMMPFAKRKGGTEVSSSNKVADDGGIESQEPPEE
jgi:transcriptional regulator of met regulon